MKRLLLIDSHAYMHRAFHALPSLTTRTGEQVGAVYGFFLALFKMVKEFEPEYVAAAFDTAAPTFRREEYDAYKATRPKTPPDLVSQFALVREALGGIGIPVLSADGYEADDVIGTLVSLLSDKKDVEIIIMTGDMDTAQLVGDRVKVSAPRKGIRDSVLYTTSLIQEKFGGVTPSQIADYKGLRGDPADNIPGVTGVGEKTAIALLVRYGSLETLYEAIERGGISGIAPKTLEALQAHKREAFQGKRLATIYCEVPLEFSLEDAKRTGWSASGAEKIFHRLGFATLIRRLPEVMGGGGKGEGEGGTLPLAQDMRARVEEMVREGLWSNEIYELELALIPVLEHMEEAGIMIDREYFGTIERELGKEICGLEKEIGRSVGGELNPSSPSQLSRLLFETLSIPARGIKKTPKGAISTASEELEKIRSLHPVVDMVLSHRELSKLQTTYVRPLPALADSRGRVHSHFDQLGTATGRLSSSNPNLQNIPAQGPWALRIRKGFVSPEGRSLLSFDYAQMELRVASHLSADRKMLSYFQEGADIHAMTAAEVFSLPVERVDGEARRKAKALNFGVLYGMGARSFARTTGMSQKEAEEFIERYFVRFPGILAYRERIKAFAKEHGYVETLFGRRRLVPEIRSANQRLRSSAERIAVNHPIQGTSADIMKMAMRSIWNEVLSGQSDARMLIQIHDELLFECRDDTIESYGTRIKKIMEGVVPLTAPLLVRAMTGKNWGEMGPVG